MIYNFSEEESLFDRYSGNNIDKNFEKDNSAFYANKEYLDFNNENGSTQNSENLFQNIYGESYNNNEINEDNIKEIFFPAINNDDEEEIFSKQTTPIEETSVFQRNVETESFKLVPAQEEEINESNKCNESNECIIKNMTEETKSNNKELLGKKRKDNYSPDKIGKRVRIVILKAILDFINRKIKYFYKNIGKGLLEKQFQEIDKKNLSHSRVGFDKYFIELKLKEIFSWNISGKITRFLKDHNKKLLELLIQSENEGEYFQELFELTFSQCLEHIQGEKNYDVLNGMMNIKEIIENFCDKKEIQDNDFNDNFMEVFKNYQNFVGRKTPRKKNKQ